MKCVILFACVAATFALEDVCDTFCAKTFSVHTTQNGNNDIDACRQGCNLKRRIEYSGDNSLPSVHMDRCVEQCGDAFKTEGRLLKACNKGCGHDLAIKNTNTVTPTSEGIKVEMIETETKKPDAVFIEGTRPLLGIGPVILTPEQIASNEKAAAEESKLLGEDGGVNNPFAGRQFLGVGPVILTADQINSNEKAEAEEATLLGEDGGAKNPYADEFQAPHLLGEDGGATNPFAQEVQQKKQMERVPRDDLAVPAKATKTAHATQQGLLGEDHGVSNPFASEFQPFHSNGLLGQDHGAMNPFASEFQPRQHKFGENGGVFNPFGMDRFKFQRPQYSEIIISANGQPPFSMNTDQFFQDFDKIFDEVEGGFDKNSRAQLRSQVNEVGDLLNRLMNFGRREEMSFDLASHEPSPPTNGRFSSYDEDIHSEREWIRCLKRRARNMAHATQGLLMLSLIMLICVALCFCHRRANARRSMLTQHRVQYMQAASGFKPPPSYYAPPSNEVKLGVESPSKVAHPLVHTPPPAYEEQQKQEAEKDLEDIKIVA